MASLFDFSNARVGFSANIGCVPGSIEREFVNRLSSIVNTVSAKKYSNDIDTFRLQYLLSEISTKSPFGRNSNDLKTRTELAISKTLASNDHCRRFNENPLPLTVGDGSILVRARHIIATILGKFNYGVYEQAAFSGGASTTHKFGRSNPFAKYGSLEYGCIEVTPRAYTRLLALIDNTPCMKRAYLAHKFNTGKEPIVQVDCDVVKTVPKNSVTDRTILIQPAGNNILQKAIGNVIRRKLKAFGVDLRDQSINQELARVGSLRGSHATIDLSSASDTVNYRIVWELLPPDWFRELEALRCTHGNVPGHESVEWQMFSAMGNAFTFELESLIFYAIAVATAESKGSYIGRINVYGDDIIVPNSIAKQVCENLVSCGFIVNDKKTHIDGFFRESCGAHWYRGIDVKPFYIRTDLTKLDSIMRLANQLRQWSSDGIVCDPRFANLWKYLSGFVPTLLWGGWDLESSHSLVTNHQPRKRLVPVTACAQIGGEGALAASFQAFSFSNTLHSKSQFFFEEFEEFSDLSCDNWVKTYEDLYYIRRNRSYGRYTSPPTWVLCAYDPYGNSYVVEHL